MIGTRREEDHRAGTIGNPFGFFRELMAQPRAVVVWVGALMCVNVASLLFWNEPAARLVFATFMVSAAMMMGLYALFGFENKLGLGHILWVPLLPYILTRLPGAADGFFHYLLLLTVSIGVSLVFDAVDTWRYFTRRRRPSQ